MCVDKHHDSVAQCFHFGKYKKRNRPKKQTNKQKKHTHTQSPSFFNLQCKTIFVVGGMLSDLCAPILSVAFSLVVF